ncbi:CsgG/HfaB family protein [Acidocella sp.]|uniref:CsgG/HfaB family protein n=1 Tax=Acidocella sp. TaxID=50710 RepID=UPI002608D362|nr:CsgG/HfaB family protein [Acidocella sp.]
MNLKNACKSTALLAAVALLSGCASIGHVRLAKDEAPVVTGPTVRDNVTPYEPALACLADRINELGRPKIVFAVGDVKDYTGKYDINQGNAITQGGSLMVESALGKLGGAVDIAERYDTQVAEMELGWMNSRELGDGQLHQLGPDGKQTVPWMPYYGGTLLASQYYIVGGITEYNYNIQSGGAQIFGNLNGPSARTYTSNVGIDLRLVDTKTLQVVDTVSLEKQVVGYEVDAGLFQFFGSNLWDVYLGEKDQEPLQLAIRAVLEEGTIDLVAAAEGINPQPCLALAGTDPKNIPAQDLRKLPDPVDQVGMPGAPGKVFGTVQGQQPALHPVNAAFAPASPQQSGGLEKVMFAYGSADISGGSEGTMMAIAQAAHKGNVIVELIAPSNENWDPSRRQMLIAQRVQAFKRALAKAGLANPALQVSWMPDATSTEIVNDGAGSQKIAILVVSSPN